MAWIAFCLVRRWLPSNYVVPLTDDEVAQLDNDEESPLSEDDEPTSIVPLPNESQELYESTPANGAADASLYWVPRVRSHPPLLSPCVP